MYNIKGIDRRQFRDLPLTRWLTDPLELRDAIVQIEKYGAKHGVDFIIRSHHSKPHTRPTLSQFLGDLNPKWGICLRKERQRGRPHEHSKPGKDNRKDIISDEGDLFHKIKREVVV